MGAYKIAAWIALAWMPTSVFIIIYLAARIEQERKLKELCEKTKRMSPKQRTFLKEN